MTGFMKPRFGVFSDAILLSFSIAEAIANAPLVTAVHRYVLLAEVINGSRIFREYPRYLLFVGYAMAYLIVSSAPECEYAPNNDPTTQVG